MVRRGHLAALLVLVAVGLLAAGCGSTSAGPAPASTAHWAGGVLGRPFAKPEFILTDTEGSPFDFRAQTAGKVTLLYFGYTNCPDVCPINMATVAAALRHLSPAITDRITVVFVTTDPQRDTPGVIRAWLNQFNPAFVGLTGSPIQIADAQLQAGLPVATKESDGHGGYGMGHAAFILVYTPDNLAHIAFPGGLRAAAEAADLQRLVTHGWARS